MASHTHSLETRACAWLDEDGNRAATRLVCWIYLTSSPLHYLHLLRESTKNKLVLLIPDPALPAAISHTWNLVWPLPLPATSHDCPDKIADTIHNLSSEQREETVIKRHQLLHQGTFLFVRLHWTCQGVWFWNYNAIYFDSSFYEYGI